MHPATENIKNFRYDRWQSERNSMRVLLIWV